MARSQTRHDALPPGLNPQLAKLWRELEESRFLEADHSLSRVEVYPAELLLPLQGSEESDGKYDDRVLATSVSSQFAPIELADDDLRGKDAFHTSELLSLRLEQDIVQYARKTSKFRMYFIRQRHSYSPLFISAQLFEKLLQAEQISAQFKRYLIFFGGREREMEVAPPALRHQLIDRRDGLEVSGSECMYCLKFAELNGRGNSEKPSTLWSLRQSAIYCRDSPTQGGIIWLFVTLSLYAQQQLEVYFITSGAHATRNPFEVHLLLLDVAISSWRPYIVDLTAEADSHSAQLLGMSPDGEGPVDLHETDRRQDLMALDERLLNSMLIIRSTKDTVMALVTALIHSHSTSADFRPIEMDKYHMGLTQLSRELDLISSQLDDLRSKLAGTTKLLSSFLELGSGFALQNLARESARESEQMRRLNERMHRVAVKGAQDAAAVTVLTILTLIYLPVTVVSNFFSTSFVNSTSSNNGQDHIVVSSDWWILLASSLPLTLLTIYIWWVWSRIKAFGKYPWWWHLLGKKWTRGSQDQPRLEAYQGTEKHERISDRVRNADDVEVLTLRDAYQSPQRYASQTRV